MGEETEGSADNFKSLGIYLTEAGQRNEKGTKQSWRTLVHKILISVKLDVQLLTVILEHESKTMREQKFCFLTCNVANENIKGSDFLFEKECVSLSLLIMKHLCTNVVFPCHYIPH